MVIGHEITHGFDDQVNTMIYSRCEGITYVPLCTNAAVHAGKGFSQYLKGVRHEIFDFMLFHESVSPRRLSIPLGLFGFYTN
jgi:hypothetical protein